MTIAEKTTFILNSEYIEQVALLNDAQAGQLFRAILQYANENCTDPIADPVVGMVFSFVRQQMDRDYKKYEEACQKRAEAGRKAGKASAEKRALRKQQAQNPTNVNDDQPFQHECECECDSDCECECDLDLEQQQRQEEGEDTRAYAKIDEDHVIYPHGANRIPTNAIEVLKFRNLAEDLCIKYKHKRATPMDIDKTMETAYLPAYNEYGQGYAAYDQGRADLLEFAFRQAALQDQVKWSYIDTILDKYRKNGIETVEQAEEYEFMRYRGEVL